jgi:molybdenum cofactor biosynthesis enzyme MoaA
VSVSAGGGASRAERIAQRPNRFLSRTDRAEHRPVHAVWEITLACDLKCGHCGSRAGTARKNELSTEECLDVVAELAALGTRDVTLIGGEAYLRRDFPTIIAAVRDAGMQCTLQSGGRNLTAERVRAAADAGLTAAGISIDGLRELHDELRGVRGSFDAAVASLERLREHGIRTSVNTQIGPAVLDQLDGVLDVVIASGAKNWQLQLTVPMGRAGDHPERAVPRCRPTRTPAGPCATSISPRSGGRRRSSRSRASAATRSGVSAAPAITRTSAAAAAPGWRTACSTSPGTTRSATTARSS